jgi:type I restriction enzyme S subunit
VNLVPITQVAKILSGSTPRGVDESFIPDGEIPFLRVSDMNVKGNEREMTNCLNTLSLENANRLKVKVASKGTVIFPKRGGAIFTNKKRILSRPSAYDLNTMGLEPKDNVNPDYFFYWFNSLDLGSLANGSSVPQLNNKQIEPLKIPLPPLATQQKIAAILDAADAHRQKTKQLLAKYDALAQSIFLEMFGDPVTNPKGWEVKRLEKVCDKITDGTHHSPEPTTEGAPYVTAKHVKPFKLSFLSKPTYISWQNHEAIYKRCSPKKGDVLYIKDGATTGIACINTFEEEISLLSSLALIQTNRQLLNPDFLCFWLNYENMKTQLLSIWMSGAAIQRYTLKKIKSFEIMIPPIEIQERFSLIINENEKIKSVMNKEIKESENLFNSLLQKAYNGELVK